MRTFVYRWFEQHVWAGDAVLGALMLVALWFNALDYRYTHPILVPFLLVSAAPMFIRRSSPQWAMILGVGLLLINLRVVESANVAVILAPVLVHSCVAHARSKTWGRAALTLGLLGALAAPIRWGYWASDPTVLAIAVGFCAITVVAAFILGERQRDRVERQTEQLRSLTERASLLAAEREQRARIAAATERARIARELHDIVAHSLSVVIVQADGASAAVGARPELAVSVLNTISETSREALSEMRRLVGVLRTDPAGTGSYAPAQGAADLSSLVEQVRQAGTRVELRISGARFNLPPGLDLTVYRLVQEALTNVLKHAGPAAAASVELAWERGSVRVAVTDDGRGAASTPGPPDGHGLLGMRERVWLQGGRLAVGPRTGGGFRVEAWFDVRAPRTEEASMTEGPQ